MLELLVTLAFALVVLAGAVQLARARPAIGRLREEIGTSSAPPASGSDLERRASVARWEAQRDLLVAAVFLLAAGAMLTSLGDPVRRAVPWLDRRAMILIFFAVGIAGIALAISRGSARATRYGLVCPDCGAALGGGEDQTREVLRTGRCRKCRRPLFGGQANA